MQIPGLLLFDLGGVLIDWDGILPLLELTEGRISAEQARRFWLESEYVRMFECGRCTPAEFASGVIRELELDLEPERFIEAFIGWDRGPLPGVGELLESLRGRIPMACLSNNNPLHWTRKRFNRGWNRYFEYQFISYEIGLVKPDREIFEYVLSHVPFHSAEIAYFDDNPECVEVAKQCGMAAFQATGVEELRSILWRFDLPV